MFNTQLFSISSELSRLQKVKQQAATGSPQIQASTQHPQAIGGGNRPIVLNKEQGTKLDFKA
jgi:hypothetical protein